MEKTNLIQKLIDIQNENEFNHFLSPNVGKLRTATQICHIIENEILKERLAQAKLKGEFSGFLKGLLISDNIFVMTENIENKIKELNKKASN